MLFRSGLRRRPTPSVLSPQKAHATVRGSEEPRREHFVSVRSDSSRRHFSRLCRTASNVLSQSQTRAGFCLLGGGKRKKKTSILYGCAYQSHRTNMGHSPDSPTPAEMMEKMSWMIVGMQPTNCLIAAPDLLFEKSPSLYIPILFQKFSEQPEGFLSINPKESQRTGKPTCTAPPTQPP